MGTPEEGYIRVSGARAAEGGGQGPRRQGMLDTEVVVETPTDSPPGAVTWADAPTAWPSAFAKAVADVSPGAVTAAETPAAAFEALTDAFA